MDTDYVNYRHWIRHRIMSKVEVRENGCMEYGRGAHKYGLISVTIKGVRKSVPAHRALWMAENDRLDLPREIYIRHKCDNPRCVNIEHLEPGSAKENMGDCVERGRRAKKYRLHTRERKFTDEQIRAIRSDDRKTCYIASDYGVSMGYISKIKNMKAKTLV